MSTITVTNWFSVICDQVLLILAPNSNHCQSVSVGDYLQVGLFTSCMLEQQGTTREVLVRYLYWYLAVWGNCSVSSCVLVFEFCRMCYSGTFPCKSPLHCCVVTSPVICLNLRFGFLRVGLRCVTPIGDPNLDVEKTRVFQFLIFLDFFPIPSFYLFSVLRVVRRLSIYLLLDC